MRFVLLWWLCVCSLVVPSRDVFAQQEAPRPQPMTEAQALERATASDPRVRAMLAMLEATRATQAARALRANPSLSFSRESVGDAHDNFVLARQELDVSGRLGRLREAGRLAVESASAAAQSRTVQVQSIVRDTFAVLLLAQEREAAIEVGAEDLRQLLALLRVREEGGEGSRYDRLRGQRALVELEADLAAAAADRAVAQGRLAALLDPGVVATSITAAGSLDLAHAPPDIASLLGQAVQSRPDLRELALNARRFTIERAAAGRLALPTPTLSGGLKQSSVGGQARSGYLFSVDLSVPFFNRGQSAAALASAEGASAEAEARVLRQQIDAQVRTAHAALEIHRIQAEQYQASVGETVESLLQVARVGYEEGELGILELLDALRQSLDGRLRALDLAAAARRAAIELDRVVGMEIRP